MLKTSQVATLQQAYQYLSVTSLSDITVVLNKHK